MLIAPVLLEKEPLLFAQDLLPGSIDYAPDIRQTGPLTVTGRADLLVEHRGHNVEVDDIRLRAAYKGHFELLCARCLEAVPAPLSGSFDLIFRPHSVDAETGERAISPDETEIGYYEESGLLLEDVVREQVLLSLPARTLCSEGCKGLCPRCGQNLNLASCTCDTSTADPRWSALRGLAGTLESK